MATPGGFEQSVFVLTAEPSDLAAITVAEITAGTAIHEDLPNPVNFSGTDNDMDTSVIASRQDRSEPGTLTPDSLDLEVFRRESGAIAIPALDDETDYWIVKFEGGNIAGGDHTDPAAGDTYDAVAVRTGTKSDVDTPRPEPRRMSVPMKISGTIQRDGTVAA